MKLSDINATHLTFDCYGTLIDWETGILGALRPFLQSYGREVADRELLELYGRFEPLVEAGSFKIYRVVLREVVQMFGKHFGFQPAVAELDLLADSICNWLPFPDTVPALQRLSQRYSLNILSNIDRDLIAYSEMQLKVAFSEVMTAEEIGSYKPKPANFEFASTRLGIPTSQVLHVAQSRYHDIAPAKRLGWQTVWVNRRRGKSGGGATPVSVAQPDWEVGSLGELADLLLAES